MFIFKLHVVMHIIDSIKYYILDINTFCLTMDGSKKLSSETMLLNPVSADIFNDIIYETEEQQKSVYNSDLIIVDNYGCIKVTLYLKYLVQY